MSAGRVTGRSAARGAAVTTGGQAVRIVVQLTGIVVLARLLDPADYGVVAMAVAIVGVGEVLRDFGLSSAAVQARELSDAQRSNLFWLNTGIGAVLMLAFAAASQLIAALYDDQRLVLVALALSTTFLLNGMATQHRADLTRRMRFLALTVTDTSSQVAGLAVAVVAAAAGAGYWALVAQQVTAAVVQLAVVAVQTRWVPGPPRRGVPMRGFLTFGSNLAAAQLLGYASRNVDSVIIGATVGATALGLYNRAFQLMTLPLTQISAPSTRVALPVLSRLHDDRERFATYLRVGQGALLSVTSFGLALCAAQADAVIAVALGPQWEEVVLLFRVLCIAGFATSAGQVVYWVVLAQGLTGALLRFSLFSRPLMIVAVVIGALWGVVGVAAAYAAASLLLWPAQLLWLSRRSDAPAGALFTGALRLLLVHALAAAASWSATGAVDGVWPMSSLLQLATGGSLLVGWLALTALLLPAYRRDLRDLRLIATTMRQRHLPRSSRAQATTSGGAR